ncbi:hypothetical protein RB2083_3480 [Rhodobacteraceae bacterium HTCC2083]|nr:hypothetical protein RB2083_3480 [Rhodobacteraceae bacterium HTCC2083]
MLSRNFIFSSVEPLLPYLQIFSGTAYVEEITGVSPED